MIGQEQLRAQRLATGVDKRSGLDLFDSPPRPPCFSAIHDAIIVVGVRSRVAICTFLMVPSIHDVVEGSRILHSNFACHSISSLKEQVPAGFQPGYSKTEYDGQPTNHAAEDSGERLGSPVFSDWMRFLPTTDGAVEPHACCAGEVGAGEGYARADPQRSCIGEFGYDLMILLPDNLLAFVGRHCGIRLLLGKES